MSFSGRVKRNGKNSLKVLLNDPQLASALRMQLHAGVTVHACGRALDFLRYSSDPTTPENDQRRFEIGDLFVRAIFLPVHIRCRYCQAALQARAWTTDPLLNPGVAYVSIN